MTNRPDFTADQRKRLTWLGVTPEQIAELVRVLPSIQWTTQSVAVADIHKRLSTIAADAAKLAKELKQLKRPHDSATGQASFLLWEAHGQRLHDDRYAAPLEPMQLNLPPDKLALEIERLSSIANAAMARLKDKRGKLKQTRHRIADPQPVSFIDDALLDGWGKTYTDHLTDEQLRRGECPRPLPEYPFGPGERGHRAKFRKVVEICYQAAGHPNADPERACKAYSARERARFAELYEWTEISPTHGVGKRKGGRPKK